MQVEQITDVVAFHGEGPVWSESWGGLRWVDMLAGDVLSLRPDGSVDRRNVGKVVAALRPRRGGGAVLGLERGFALESADGEVTALEELWSEDGLRMNEGACDPDGRFYCGSMAYDKRKGAGSIYRLDGDGSVHVVLEGVTISNGLDWSPSGTLAYYNDTDTFRTDVFDYDPDRGLSNRRTFVALDDARPDGLAVDSEGGVWVALANKGAVRRYSETGVLDEEIKLPVPKVTACTFGGPDLDQLFITTSQENVDTAAFPLAGALFRAEPRVKGIPARQFAG